MARTVQAPALLKVPVQNAAAVATPVSRKVVIPPGPYDVGSRPDLLGNIDFSTGFISHDPAVAKRIAVCLNANFLSGLRAMYGRGPATSDDQATATTAGRADLKANALRRRQIAAKFAK
jgi:hypothetical protein